MQMLQMIIKQYDIKKLAIGIDMGRTEIKGALVDNQGNIISKAKKVKTESKKGQERILENLKRLVREIIFQAQYSRIKNNQNQFLHRTLFESKYKIIGIGIGCPGPLDPKTGTIINPPNFPFRDFNLKKYLEKEFKLSVSIENDANSAAIGEVWKGAGQNYKKFVLLTLGTGIGSGIVINNKIYHGQKKEFSELGHIPIAKNGPNCPLGHMACLESLISGAAIKKKYNQSFEKIVSIDTDQSRQIIKEWQNSFFAGIKMIKKKINPEAVILSGGMIKSWNKLIKPIENRSPIPLKKAKLGLNAGIIGAAKLAFYKLVEN